MTHLIDEHSVQHFKQQFGCTDLSWNLKLEHDTDLQIDLQALVIHFCFKSDKMELFCDNQRGLQKADAVWKNCRTCIKSQEKPFLAEQTILSQISRHELGLSTFYKYHLHHCSSGHHFHTSVLSGSVTNRMSLLQSRFLSEDFITAAGNSLASITHQVFKLCWQAAIVGFLHVHDFCVGAEDIKLPWPKTIQEQQTVLNTNPRKYSSLQRKALKILPSNCSHVSRFPET